MDCSAFGICNFASTSGSFGDDGTCVLKSVYSLSDMHSYQPVSLATVPVFFPVPHQFLSLISCPLPWELQQLCPSCTCQSCSYSCWLSPALLPVPPGADRTGLSSSMHTEKTLAASSCSQTEVITTFHLLLVRSLIHCDRTCIRRRPQPAPRCRDSPSYL